MEQTSDRQARRPWPWWAWQALILGVLAGLVLWTLFTPIESSLSSVYASFYALDYSFMDGSAGFDVGFSLVSYDLATATYWDVLVVGVLNTLLLVALSTASATAFALLLARAMNGGEAMLARTLSAVIATLRGLPLLGVALIAAAAAEAVLPWPAVRAWPIPLSLLAAWLTLSLYFAVAMADDLRAIRQGALSICAGHWPQIVKWSGYAAVVVSYPELLSLVGGSAMNQTGHFVELLLLLVASILALAWIARSLGSLLSRPTMQHGGTAQERQVPASPRPRSRVPALLLLALLAFAGWRLFDWAVLDSVVRGEDPSLCRIAEAGSEAEDELAEVDWSALEMAGAGDASSRSQRSLQRAVYLLERFDQRFAAAPPALVADLAELYPIPGAPDGVQRLRALVDAKDYGAAHALAQQFAPAFAWGDDHDGACWLVIGARGTLLLAYLTEWHWEWLLPVSVLAVLGIVLLVHRRWRWSGGAGLAALAAASVLAVELGSQLRYGGLVLTLILWVLAVAAAFALGAAGEAARRSRVPLLRWISSGLALLLLYLPPPLLFFLLQVLAPVLPFLAAPGFWSLPLLLGLSGAAHLVLQRNARNPVAQVNARFAVAAGMLRDLPWMAAIGTLGLLDLLGAAQMAMTDAKWKGLTFELLLPVGLVFVLLHLLLRRLMRPSPGLPPSPPYA